MDAKDLLVDDGRKGEDIEDVLELLPHLDIVPPLALVVEAVDAVDRRALVVAAQQEEVFRVLDLVRKQQADDLEAVLATVDVVAARTGKRRTREVRPNGEHTRERRARRAQASRMK